MARDPDAAALDAGAGEPGVRAGEGGRGAAPRRVPRSGRRAGRLPDGARIRHALPRARPGRLLPARRVRLCAPRPRASSPPGPSSGPPPPSSSPSLAPTFRSVASTIPILISSSVPHSSASSRR
ncbi:hypothetical protein PVAP13_6KG241706 [Panicum virgatum]|uniref:Uncharacterized protein n=1 Tax=Panicum virgatum TaxID=38727 RepID=A0A8T0RFF3_PANVG|nr:hypothetical protein PVAP13_6KG241706 [Panicum virgatum]